MTRKGFYIRAAIAATVLGCGEQAAAPTVGEERGACYPNGTCNTGLLCLSSTCVRFEGNAGGAAGSTSLGDTGVTGGGGATTDATANGGAAGTSAADASVDADKTDASAPSDARSDGQIKEAGPDVCLGAYGVASGPTEPVTVSACGYDFGTTINTYNGFVTITASGTIRGSIQSLFDSFYLVESNTMTTECGSCLFLYRSTDGGGVNVNCSTSGEHVASLVVGPHPSYNLNHEYTVMLNLGNGPRQRLSFGSPDCSCEDNSGALTVKITPVNNVMCSNL